MFFRDSGLTVVAIRAVIALVASLTCASSAAAQSAIRAIGVSTVGGEAIVTVEGNGPLPTPTLGALDGPPRIFLDFADVRLAARGLIRTPDPRVRRVRVGVFSVSPLVTRVVIDLIAVLPHRIELATGRVMLFVGGPTATQPNAPPITATPQPPDVTPPQPRPSNAPARTDDGIPPVPPLPPPLSEAKASNEPAGSSSGATDARLPYRPPTAPPPPKDVVKYREQVSTILERLKMQLPLLGGMQSLDASLEEDIDDRMPAALLEFDRLRAELDAIKPPETVRSQHELIVQATRLGSTAARLRLEANQTRNAAVRRNAASAAAGASLMLDRAFAEVGFGQGGR
jgi:hypothetical protein